MPVTCDTLRIERIRFLLMWTDFRRKWDSIPTLNQKKYEFGVYPEIHWLHYALFKCSAIFNGILYLQSHILLKCSVYLCFQHKWHELTWSFLINIKKPVGTDYRIHENSAHSLGTIIIFWKTVLHTLYKMVQSNIKW